MWPLRSASESALIAGPSAKADVIVSEILDATLIGEGVLHTMRDATARLLAPGGRLVPCGARIYCMAVELGTPEAHPSLTFGFLERLRQPVIYTAARLHTLGHVRLSAPAEALHFDFYHPTPLGDDGRPPDREVRLKLPVLRRGRCNAIVWWFDLELDEETLLTAGPGATVRTWKQNFFHLPAPLAVAKGDIVEALVWTQGDDQIHVYGGSEGVTPPERQSGPAEKVRLEGNFLKDR